ncbi:MAG: hypothetical protein IKM32_04415 [Clostridia bacterium]|nr:hypothetical protein [Clostridia bacterium]
MLYYRLFVEKTLWGEDIITFFFVGTILAFVSFFLIRDYFRVKRKKFFGPTGKLVAGIICGVVSAFHLFVLLLV